MRHSSFSVGEFSSKDSFAAAEAVARSWADIEFCGAHDQCELTWNMWQLGDLVVSQVGHSPLRFDRGHPRFRRFESDFLLLEMFESGVGLGRAGEGCFQNGRGRISLIDMSKGFLNVTGQIKTRSLLIPHSAIAFDPSVHPPVISLMHDSPRGRLLMEALWTLPDRIQGVSDAEALGLANEVVEVVRALMLTPERAEPDAVFRARRLAMENYIEARLSKHDLGVSDLCLAFGLSRAALYRHFAATGGVAGYIRGRRLNAAYRELTARGPTRGLVREVAERYGFSDAGHFSRVFKRRFAQTAAEAAASSNRIGPILTDPVSLLENWYPPGGAGLTR